MLVVAGAFFFPDIASALLFFSSIEEEESDDARLLFSGKEVRKRILPLEACLPLLSAMRKRRIFPPLDASSSRPSAPSKD